jgi:hypothetical protein
LTPGGSNTVHIYTQTINRTTQSTQTIHRKKPFTNQKECGPCPVLARYTLAFALQLRKKHEKTSMRIAGKCPFAKNIQNKAYISINTTEHINVLCKYGEEYLSVEPGGTQSNHWALNC